MQYQLRINKEAKMKTNDNNSLTIIKESFFDKIKKLFMRNKFEIQSNNFEMEEIKTSNNSNQSTKQNNFFDDIKLKNDKNSSLEELQYLIRNKQITEEDLTSEQIEDLRQLYNSQISQLKDSIQMYKHKIMRLKNKNVKKYFN